MMGPNPWWKEIIMYQIYPRSFQDSNGDGIGDIPGIIQRIDHLKDLGINLIWLGPVYESPNDDNGYDISDYRKIHPEFGTMEQFDELLEKLHNAGIKLIMDLVVNHSSDEHEWFQKSRQSKDNPYRDFYFWRKGNDGGPPNNWKAWFGGDAWDHDPLTDEYYLHLFTTKQPDLNWENPQVRKEVYDIMKFWLDKGVDGFRMDVISLISKRIAFENSPSEIFMDMVNNYYSNGPRVHEYLQEMNKEVLSKYDVVTVGEGPGITADIANDYIGNDREELNMIFQLELMFFDNGPGGKFDPQPISLVDFKSLFSRWDKAVGDKGWNNIFLDNHDFPRMLSRFGNDKKYRIESAQLLAMFLLTMRGTPCIYQGSEIGMTNVEFDDIEDYRDIETINYYKEGIEAGITKHALLENIYIQGRDNARTPMQWDESQYAGFSEAEPWIKLNPNYALINAQSDKSHNKSIYRFYQKMIQYRKAHNVLTYGSYHDILPSHDHLYIYKRKLQETEVLVALNFSDSSIDIPVELITSDMNLHLGNYGLQVPDSLRPWEARLYSNKVD